MANKKVQECISICLTTRLAALFASGGPVGKFCNENKEEDESE